MSQVPRKQDLRKCVIRILNPSGQAVGTGFVVSDLLAVTCMHIVKASGSDQGQQVSIQFLSNASQQVAKVLSEGHAPIDADDVAFLQLGKIPDGVVPAVLGSAESRNGDHYELFGTQRLADYDYRWGKGEIFGIVPVTGKSKRPMLQMTGDDIEPGMSGAPVLNIESNLVIGMISEYQDRTSGRRIVWATTSDTLVELNPSLRLLRDFDDLNALNSSPELLSNTGTTSIPQRRVDTSELSEPVEIAIRALADTPSNIDLLRFSDYADALVDFIKSDKTQKPLTIAIDAPWGMGKTTLMEMIKNRLKPKESKARRLFPIDWLKSRPKDQDDQTKISFPIVWFNAWKYDQEGSLWAALAVEILNQVRKQFKFRKRLGFWWNLTLKRLGNKNRLLQLILNLLPYVLGLLVIGIIIFLIAWFWQGDMLIETIKKISLPIVGVLGGLTIFYATLKEVYTRFIKPLDQKVAQYVREPNYKDRIGFLAQFEEDFKSVVEAATSNGKWPLIIFIDDLDRCAPPKPVEIIEAINLLLDAKDCVFVIGMDASTVAGSIEAKYKDSQGYLDTLDTPGELTLGHRFLEKIIQITFHIPRADTAVVQSFIDMILVSAKEDLQTQRPDEEVRKAEQLIIAEQRTGKNLNDAAEAVQKAIPISPLSLDQAIKEVRAKSFDDSEEVKRAITYAVPYLELNPRKIKRFINIFRLQAYIANRRGLLDTGTIQLSLLAKWIIIVTRWPCIIEAMMDDENFLVNLIEAHNASEQFRNFKADSKSPFYTGSISQQIEQAKIDLYLTNPHITRLIDATDLIKLLNQMTDSERETLFSYLYLTKTTVDMPRKDSERA